MGRWFGIARDDEMNAAGWGRTGTLPRNETAHRYAVVPQEDLEPEPVGGSMELGERRTTGAADYRRRRGERAGRGGRSLVATLTLQRGQRPTTREDVQNTLPKFWPVATVLVALAEIALLLAILIQDGFAPIAFKPRTVRQVVSGFGNSTDFVSREDVPNFFIGPSSSSLIHVGAQYTPVSE